MGWNLKECSQIGKKLTAYCIDNSIKIKVCETNDERFGEVNSYPQTAPALFVSVGKLFCAGNGLNPRRLNRQRGLT